MIQRTDHVEAMARLLREYPVVGIIGARQVGKTTLARQLVEARNGSATVFDLEDPADRARMAEPSLALGDVRGLVVLDEIQRMPEVFPTLRVLADRPRIPARFLILGSASPELLRQGSESLAGRIAYREIGGFSLSEVGPSNHGRLWLRGGFPRAYTARSLSQSLDWRNQFIDTFLERDLPQLGIRISSQALRRFWTMLAHYHGQVWNASEFARSFGVADTTVRHYLDVLTSALVVKQLHPWHENLKKRQVKSPKVYLADTGLLHSLLNLKTMKDLEGHPKLGASWEGFAIQEAIQRLGARRKECFFWATHAGAELDLLVVRGRKRVGVEVKRTSAPKITKSMLTAMEDLALSELYVIHAGRDAFPMAKRIKAVPIHGLHDTLKPLR